MTLHSPLLRDLHARGLIKDINDLDGLDRILASGRKIAVFAGFDCTATSLHVGSLTPLLVLKRFKEHGHTVLPVVGTATTLVGDPSGRATERPMADMDTVARNRLGIEESIRRVLGDVPILANGDWLQMIHLIPFLREVGPHVTIPKMLGMESVRSRLDREEGTMTFLEFTYSLLQGFDFLHLARQHEVLLQIGGSDQWGNLLVGLELIQKHRVEGAFFGMTLPLLLDAKGQKIGKTSMGKAAWLNPDLLDDFGFFQFFRDLPDADLAPLALRFSAAAPEVTAQALSGDRNLLKAALAQEMTSLVRGEAAALKARHAAEAAFSGADDPNLPTHELRELGGSWSMVARDAGLASSLGEARRLMGQGGLFLNGKVLLDDRLLCQEDFIQGVARLVRGKKQIRRVVLAG